MAACPSFSACCSAMKPSWSRSSVLAPAASSSCTHSMWPWLAATIRAVPSLGPRRSIPALCSSSRRIMACWSSPAAIMRAVISLAPCRRPRDAAAISSPAPFSASASTCPPVCSHLTTGCSSPRAAATAISRGSDIGRVRAFVTERDQERAPKKVAPRSITSD
eukprot:scaffold42947_cov71-Phaeocystis_antarctica.AAC.1